MNTILKSRPAAKVLAAITTAQIFPDLAVPSTAVALFIPGTNRLEQKKFTVRASGNALTAGATTTVLVSLYIAKLLPAASLVPANWTVMCAGSARVVNTISAPWWIEAELAFDSAGGKLGGTFNQMVNNLFDAPAAITGVLTGLNGTGLPVVQPGPVTIQPADPVFVVGVGITYGVNASVGNIANLQNFVLEA